MPKIRKLQWDNEDFCGTFHESFKSRSKKKLSGHRGNIEGLAKHLVKKHGGDPHFFTKCMQDDALNGYDDEVKKAICARAHKIAIGKWPGEHASEEKEFIETLRRKISKKSYDKGYGRSFKIKKGG